MGYVIKNKVTGEYIRRSGTTYIEVPLSLATIYTSKKITENVLKKGYRFKLRPEEYEILPTVTILESHFNHLINSCAIQSPSNKE